MASRTIQGGGWFYWVTDHTWMQIHARTVVRTEKTGLASVYLKLRLPFPTIEDPKTAWDRLSVSPTYNFLVADAATGSDQRSPWGLPKNSLTPHRGGGGCSHEANNQDLENFLVVSCPWNGSLSPPRLVPAHAYDSVPSRKATLRCPDSTLSSCGRSARPFHKLRTTQIRVHSMIKPLSSFSIPPRETT